MALNLNIPILVEHPVFIAETRPQKIRLLLQETHTQNPLEIAAHLLSELEILNRQKISPTQRLLALDCYQALIKQTVDVLAESYTHSMLPLHEQAKTATIAAENLWQELGYGYKLALIDIQNQLIKLGTDKSSAHAIQRAIQALSEQALVNYQTYQIPPAFIWSDLHQLYLYAVQLGLHHNQNHEDAAKSAPTETDTHAHLVNSIEDAYKHAMLISLAQPQHLTQKDIKRVASYLAYHVQQARITAIEKSDNTPGVFIIGLNSSAPPTPYTKQKNAPNPVSDILLHTIDLVRESHQDLNRLQNNLLPSNGSITAEDNLQEYIVLLTYLIKNWGLAPKRIFTRATKNGEVELIAGIEAIQKSALHAMTDHMTRNQMAAHSAPSRWKVLNMSANGISIRRHHTAEKNITIGELIAVRAKNEMHWAIGLVRWANCGTRDRLDIGVQLIAPSATNAIAHTLEHNASHGVLLLPEILTIKQPATIITPTGLYQPGQKCMMTHDNIKTHILLTKVIERTHAIERFEFTTQ
ncbi:MAG: hypothetical protein CVU29_08100 [Betaproteobacteria bacterium HGW-Betaproteobacteria-22]|nr:MAG: hypothetical protein CVU29_08100 [Betaproteobacteria bacterium HGW-Betaproteobacteria-22]